VHRDTRIENAGCAKLASNRPQMAVVRDAGVTDEAIGGLVADQRLEISRNDPCCSVIGIGGWRCRSAFI
jgi:hypothetical protein